jgi:mobilization protein NikA
MSTKTPRGPGRPPSTNPRTARIPARFTAEERAELARRAALAGLSVAAFLRHRALDSDAPPQALALSSADLVRRS